LVDDKLYVIEANGAETITAIRPTLRVDGDDR
jgi:hypothetical protein